MIIFSSDDPYDPRPFLAVKIRPSAKSDDTFYPGQRQVEIITYTGLGMGEPFPGENCNST